MENGADQSEYEPMSFKNELILDLALACDKIEELEKQIAKLEKQLDSFKNKALQKQA
jgi:hypothetical protein